MTSFVLFVCLSLSLSFLPLSLCFSYCFHNGFAPLFALVSVFFKLVEFSYNCSICFTLFKIKTAQHKNAGNKMPISISKACKEIQDLKTGIYLFPNSFNEFVSSPLDRSIYISVCLFVCLSVSLYVCMSVCLSVC